MAAGFKVIPEEEETPPPPSPADRLKGFLKKIWNICRFFLIMAGLASALTFGVTLFSSETVSNGEVVQNGSGAWTDLINRESDAVPSEEEMDLWYAMIVTVIRMRQGVYTLEGNPAKEFGETFFLAEDNAGIRSIVFNADRETVTIQYDMRVNKKVILEISREHIKKTLTRNDSLASGIFGFVRWQTYMKFYKGYPRYVFTADIPNNNPNNLTSQKIQIQSVRLKPLSRLMRIFSG